MKKSKPHVPAQTGTHTAGDAAAPKWNHVALSKRIINLMRQEDWVPGLHIKEKMLVDHLGVSRTPIRSALKLLAEYGVLEARPNRGFVLKISGSALAQVYIEPQFTTVESVYLRIIDDRIAGKIPHTVSLSGLLKRYNVNRATLLRSFQRMSDEGVVVRNYGRGWTFLSTLDDVTSKTAAFQFRQLIEPASILLPSFRIDRSCISQIRQSHLDILDNIKSKTVNPDRAYEADSGFHEAIAKFSGNSFILQAIQHQSRLRRFVDYKGYRNSERLKMWCEEHLAIMDALDGHDLYGAADLMRTHLAVAFEVFQRIK